MGFLDRLGMTAGARNDSDTIVTLSEVEGSPNQSANPKLLTH